MCVFAICYKRMECCKHVHGMAIGAGVTTCLVE